MEVGVMRAKKLYRCKSCKEETSMVTLGEVYSGCLNCFNREWEEYVDGKWVEKVFRTAQTDMVMKHLM